MDEQTLSAIDAPTSLWDMPFFLKKYTLHDSYWREVRLAPMGGVLVLIGWDLHWNPEIPKSHDLLALRFPSPYSLKWNQGAWFQTTLEGATSVLVPDSEKERLLESSTVDLSAFHEGTDEVQFPALDATLTRTIFECMNMSTLEILHSQSVNIACFDQAGNVFDIPRPFNNAPR